MKSYLKKYILIGILTGFITSCFWNPIGIVSDTYKPVRSKPGLCELTGKYELDSFSYNFINSIKKYDDQKVFLTLKKNGQLILENVPDIMFNYPPYLEYKRLTYNGGWVLGKNPQDTTRYNLNIKISNLKKNGLTTSFDLLRIKGILGIWYFIGDPDSGDRFFFVKTEENLKK